MRKEMAATTAAVQAYIAMPRPTPPPLPSLEAILHAVEPFVLRASRDEVLPLLNTFRQNIESLLQVHNEELQATLWPKIAQVLEVSDLLLAWFNKEMKQGDAPPLAEVD